VARRCADLAVVVDPGPASFSSRERSAERLAVAGGQEAHLDLGAAFVRIQRPLVRDVAELDRPAPATWSANAVAAS
jgi:hypothetical protein